MEHIWSETAVPPRSLAADKTVPYSHTDTFEAVDCQKPVSRQSFLYHTSSVSLEKPHMNCSRNNYSLWWFLKDTKEGKVKTEPLPSGIFQLQSYNHGLKKVIPAFIEEVFGQRLNILKKCFAAGKSFSDQNISSIENLGNGMEEIGKKVQCHQ